MSGLRYIFRSQRCQPFDGMSLSLISDDEATQGPATETSIPVIQKLGPRSSILVENVRKNRNEGCRKVFVKAASIGADQQVLTNHASVTHHLLLQKKSKGLDSIQPKDNERRRVEALYIQPPSSQSAPPPPHSTSNPCLRPRALNNDSVEESPHPRKYIRTLKIPFFGLIGEGSLRPSRNPGYTITSSSGSATGKASIASAAGSMPERKSDQLTAL